jgi:excisionase family DNA binding protein
MKFQKGQLPERRWYRVEEISRLLNVAPKTVRKWIQTGTLIGVRLGPRTWRIDGKALFDRMDAQAAEKARARALAEK